jgi:hypothetical protein
MKPSTWIIAAGGFLILVGTVVALLKPRGERAVFRNQLRQHGVPPSFASALADHWPERLLPWTLETTRRFDHTADQARKRAVEFVHSAPRPHFRVRRSVMS